MRCLKGSFPVSLLIKEAKGAFNNYIDRFLDFFDHPPTPRRQAKYIKTDHTIKRFPAN